MRFLVKVINVCVRLRLRPASEFHSQVESIVDLQTNEEESAMFGCSEYVLRKSHQNLRCTADYWGKMTKEQHKSELSKYYRILESKSSRHVVSTDGTFAVLQSPSAGKKKITKRVDAEQIALETIA
jgi:hypothetical protein